MVGQAHEKKYKIVSLAAAVLIAVVLFLLERVFSARLLGLVQAAGEVTVWTDIIFLRALPNAAWVFSLPVSKIFICWASIAGLLAVILVYLKYFLRRDFAPALAFALILSGAASNLWSRFTLGFVWDWFNVKLFGMVGSWNLADAMIVCGMLIFLWAMMKEE
jgi:lipoprotein signal peptidase